MRRAAGAVLALVVIGLAGLRIVLLVVRTRRDHDGWVVPVAFGIVVVLIVLLVWPWMALLRRRAARLERDHPGTWACPVSRGRATLLLVVDPTTVRLLSLSGRVRDSQVRSDLVRAEVAPIRLPLATRTGLRLHFADGSVWSLLSTRGGGLGSSRPFAEEAVTILRRTGPATRA